MKPNGVMNEYWNGNVFYRWVSKSGAMHLIRYKKMTLFHVYDRHVAKFTKVKGIDEININYMLELLGKIANGPYEIKNKKRC